MKFNKKGFVSMCLAVVMLVALAIPAFAAEIPADTKSYAVSNTIEGTSSDLQPEYTSSFGVQPLGTLSGYACVNISGDQTGTFTVNVDGSWSPWGHARIKTNDFAEHATVSVKIISENETKITRDLGPNTDAKDIVYWNAKPGGYTVEVSVKNNNGATGFLQVWIY